MHHYALLVSRWTHVVRRRSGTDAEDEDDKTTGVIALRLAYHALEVLFERVLAAGDRCRFLRGNT